ncbi:Hypothetical protein D9617_1g083420 [Elsinoe fawcettii]|nr:Hypothetical protein D9617_1g083420 [Elsinoe fawcettii]
MSNRLPSMRDPLRECAYCIWYPETAREDTYRQLAHKYPLLRYQVGRACAVAGYTTLYSELNLLPDASIAEEARDNGSWAIYEAITSKPTTFKVMDDYQRLVNLEVPQNVPGLNCDTAVRSSLAVKQAIGKLCFDLSSDGMSTTDRDLFEGLDLEPTYHKGFQYQLFDITEDQSIDEVQVKDKRRLEDMMPLLFSSLPRHLPALKNKDLLIFSAAADGNVDRYQRLRRPFSFARSDEISALVRGIYHHPFFAKWCSLQPDFLDSTDIQNAITARFIMCGDVSRVTPTTNVYQIWYPVQADVETYREVLRRCPLMRQSIARAAIVIQNKQLFRRADADPSDRYLGVEAKGSQDPWFLEELTQRATEQGKEICTELKEFDRLMIPARGQIRESFNVIFAPKDVNDETSYFLRVPHGLYNGLDYDLAPIAASVVTPDEVKKHRMFAKTKQFNEQYLFPGSIVEDLEDYHVSGDGDSPDG